MLLAKQQDTDSAPSGRRHIHLFVQGCLHHKVCVSKNLRLGQDGMDRISHRFLTAWYPLFLSRCVPSEVSFPRHRSWGEDSWASCVSRASLNKKGREGSKVGKGRKSNDVSKCSLVSAGLCGVFWSEN